MTFLLMLKWMVSFWPSGRDPMFSVRTGCGKLLRINRSPVVDWLVNPGQGFKVGLIILVSLCFSGNKLFVRLHATRRRWTNCDPESLTFHQSVKNLLALCLCPGEPRPPVCWKQRLFQSRPSRAAPLDLSQGIQAASPRSMRSISEIEIRREFRTLNECSSPASIML